MDAEVEDSVLKAAMRGDERALAVIVVHYDRRLFRLAYRLLDSKELSEDAVQETYLKALKSLHRFDRRCTLGTWLYRIAYTTCIDSLRSNGRFRSVEPSELEVLAGSVSDFDESLAIREVLEAALRAIPVEERAAVLLVDREGLDYRSAAQVLGVPIGTLSSRLSHARRKLRGILESLELVQGDPDV